MSVIYNTDAALASKQDEALAVLTSILSDLATKSTADKQDTGNTYLSQIVTAVQAMKLDDDAELTVLNSILSALSGAATAANQSTANSSLASILAAQATAAKQDAAKAVLDSILTALTGASTADKQDTGNASLASIDSKMGSTTGTITSVTQTMASQVALASNASRRGMYLYNNTTKKIYIAFAATVTVSAFTIIIAANSGYESPQAAVYRGVVSVISEAAGPGAILVTEMT